MPEEGLQEVEAKEAIDEEVQEPEETPVSDFIESAEPDEKEKIDVEVKDTTGEIGDSLRAANRHRNIMDEKIEDHQKELDKIRAILKRQGWKL